VARRAAVGGGGVEGGGQPRPLSGLRRRGGEVRRTRRLANPPAAAQGRGSGEGEHEAQLPAFPFPGKLGTFDSRGLLPPPRDGAHSCLHPHPRRSLPNCLSTRARSVRERRSAPTHSTRAGTIGPRAILTSAERTARQRCHVRGIPQLISAAAAAHGPPADI
jgi:hypothetical protein